MIHISKRLSYEHFDTKSASDREIEAQSGFKLTLEYRWRWDGRMDYTHSSKKKLKGRRAPRKPSFCGDTEPEDAREIPLTVAAVLAHNGNNGAMESPTKDLNSWLDSSHCSMDGMRSGPSSPQVDRGGAVRGYAQGLCLCCRMTWEKARHTGPVKDKLLDNDPSSLSCDQWVLKKRWRPSKLPVLKSKLQGCLKQIQKKQSDVSKVVPGKATCSKAHTFLQRNLRACTKRAPARRGLKRKSMRRASTKRARRNPREEIPTPPATCDLSAGSRESPDHAPLSPDRPPLSPDLPPLSPPRTPTPEGRRTEEDAEVPSLVAMETKANQEARASKGGPAKRCGFKDLLNQMRGKHCAIVREDRL